MFYIGRPSYVTVICAEHGGILTQKGGQSHHLAFLLTVRPGRLKQLFKVNTKQLGTKKLFNYPITCSCHSLQVGPVRLLAIGQIPAY